MDAQICASHCPHLQLTQQGAHSSHLRFVNCVALRRAAWVVNLLRLLPLLSFAPTTREVLSCIWHLDFFQRKGFKAKNRANLSIHYRLNTHTSADCIHLEFYCALSCILCIFLWSRVKVGYRRLVRSPVLLL